MMIRERGCRRAVSRARPARRRCSSTRRQLRMRPRAQNLHRCFYNSHLSCLVQPRLLEGLSLLLRKLPLAKLLQELLLLARLGLSLLLVMWMEGSPSSANTSMIRKTSRVSLFSHSLSSSATEPILSSNRGVKKPKKNNNIKGVFMCVLSPWQPCAQPSWPASPSPRQP